MSGNMQKLGNILSDRMKKTASGAVPTMLELGIINGNMSLTTDSLKSAIPKGEYMVNLTLASASYNTSNETHTHTGGEHAQYSGSGQHTHSDGEHNHRLPEDFRALKSGDRVLVAWCGNEPVVIAIVISS